MRILLSQVNGPLAPSSSSSTLHWEGKAVSQLKSISVIKKWKQDLENTLAVVPLPRWTTSFVRKLTLMMLVLSSILHIYYCSIYYNIIFHILYSIYYYFLYIICIIIFSIVLYFIYYCILYIICIIIFYMLLYILYIIILFIIFS